MQLKFQVFILFFIFSQQPQARIVENVLAVVEGQMILKSEIKSFQRNLNQKVLINKNLVSFLNLKTTSKSEKEILNYLIAKKIIITFTKKELNISNLDKLINTELRDLAKQNNISVKQLQKKITSEGISFEDYKIFVGESSLIRSTLEKNVISQVRPTEEDFVSYLKQNNVSDIIPSYTYNLDQIFISKKTPNALQLAKSITKDNFSNSSKNLNIEFLNLGVLKNSELSNAHAKAVVSLQQNNISAVLKESEGFRIFYINSKKGNFNIPNTSKVHSLQRKYYDSKIKTKFKNWFGEIKPQFFVRIND